MCWVALDRAIALAEPLGAVDRVEAWTAAGDEIPTAILDRGWSDRAGAFTQAFGSDDLDARRPGGRGGHLPALHLLAGRAIAQAG
jgi:GH15 family glucan-1,4-alpha-glucosidase